MMTSPINTEARAAVRRFKAGLERTRALVLGARENAELNRALVALVRKKSAPGRARARARVERLIPGLALEELCLGLTIWSYLRPGGAIIAETADPGERQAAVTMEYLLAGVNDVGRLSARTGFWSLEVPDHALGRLAQRAPGVDLGAVLREAHRAVLRARVPTPLPLRPASVRLPAGPGFFVGHLVYGRDESDAADRIVYYRARTWLHRDQVEDEGAAVLVAGEPSLGSALMLPRPLRRYERTDDGRIGVASLDRLAS